MSGPTWDDARIAAAYRDLTAVETPAEIREAISQPRTAPDVRSRGIVAPSWLAIAAVVVIAVVAVGANLFGRWTGPATTIPSALPSTIPSVVPSAVTTPPGTPWPSPILATMSVSELLAFLEGPIDDREIAVHGYLTPFMALPCPAPGDPSPVTLRCPDTFRFLMEAPEDVVDVTPGSVGVHRPSGPAITPRFIETTSVELTQGAQEPMEVVAVGHVDDPRASLCPASERDTCRHTFVVDRILPPFPVLALQLPDHPEIPSAADHDPNQVLDVVSKATGLPPDVLMFQPTDGPGLARIQPVTAGTRWLVDAGPVWMIRLLDPDGVGRTFAIRDEDVGSAAPRIVELARDGLTPVG